MARKLRNALAPLTIVAALALPASAFAGTASISGAQLRYVDTAGTQQNQAVITYDGGNSRYHLTDSGFGGLTVGSGCVTDGGSGAYCPSAGITSAFVDLSGGNMNDVDLHGNVADAVPVPATITAHTDLTGSSFGSHLRGGSAGDSITDTGVGTA